MKNKKQNEKMNVSILADAVEALIGAIYIDGGNKSSIKFIKMYLYYGIIIRSSKDLF